MWRAFASLGLASLFATVTFACTDSAKTSETKAVAHVERLAKLADEDVEEVRRGLPHGAKSLGTFWDGKKDLVEPSQARRALESVRDEDRDLAMAKSTFFAFTDEKGIVLRSDQEPDLLAGKSLVASYPAMTKVLAGEAIETRGSMSETAGSRTGTDEQWVAAAPVRDGQGTVRGLYASGWSMRRFAYHLEEAIKHDLTTDALRAGDKHVKLPLVYVFVLAGAKVYGAPVTPLVNSETLEKLDLASKTTGDATFHQTIEITGRGFGLAARRATHMGADIGVVVLRSET
ncbi:MAG TPA: hypothetical protein VK550_10370 [Polyangiaceae bacterium]|nr:hypothetical protein [Polyangiaceae bacterium]